MLTRVNNSVTKSPAFNAVGQKTDDGVNYAYDWDAFGRLRKVKNRTTSALVVEYTYNGLNQQIGRHADLDADGDVDSTDKWEWTIYDPRWRRAATYMVAGGSTFGGAADSDPKERYVHHAAGRSGGGSYLDSVILRDRDQNGGGGNNGAADGTLEQRVYFGQNWRADVSVLMTSAGRILERLTYSAYGVATRHPVADFNRDGFTDFFDDLAYDDCFDGSGCPSGQTADMNLDGFVDSFDYDEWDLSYAEQVNTARGVLSQNDASAAVNRLGYAGYWFEPSTQTYLVRNREYDPNTGVWDERDPMGYHDGADLYMYVMDSPIIGLDPMGLYMQAGSCGGNTVCGGGLSTSQPQVDELDGDSDAVQDMIQACNRKVSECINSSAVLNRIAAELDLCRRRARPPRAVMNISCSFCLNAPSGIGAAYLCQSDTVVVCANLTANTTGDQFCSLVAHELSHALDACRSGFGCGFVSTCNDIACTEVRAYNRSGMCCQGGGHRRPNETYQGCIRRLARGSLDAFAPCDLPDAAMEHAMSTCYNPAQSPCGAN
jgi:RHS repeat-associated protein